MTIRSRETAWEETDVPGKADVRPIAVERMTSETERDLLLMLRRFAARFRDGREPENVLRQALRLGMEFFGAPEGCIATRLGEEAEADIAFSIPRDAGWDRTMLAAFIQREQTDVVADQMVARIRRHGRKWGVVSIRAPGADFRWDARRAFSLVGETVGEIIDRIDIERMRDVRAKIDRKIMEQIRPKDLVYQILHGLRSLTDYDHSASILMCDESMRTLELVAEQIAWRKGKSRHIGLKLPIGDAVRELLSRQTVYSFDRDDLEWHERTGRAASELAELLDFNLVNSTDPSETAETSMLCAPLLTRDGVLGVIKVSSLRRGTFGEYEVDLLSRFLPQVSIAMRNAKRTESLEESILLAERKHAMADLARGVSHDVNNAVGAILPLVQDLQDAAANGGVDPDTLLEDLNHIERSIQICRRIFGGMLRFARGAMQNAGEVCLRHEINCTMELMSDTLLRSGVDVTIDVPDDLPAIRGVAADVEQLLLNIITNARDAMPNGGTIRIEAKSSGDDVDLSVTDTGVGIPRRLLAQVQEPFFTTKPAGNGLGLSICRSILSQMNGRMSIDSTPGVGTTVRLQLPMLREVEREAAE
jgi:two-component system, NtrC family, sensor kinase